MELLFSSVLASRHGFSTRLGGVSAAPYDSLNVSVTVGDEASRVAENLSRLQRAAGAERLLLMNQVHGEVVVDDVDGATADGVMTRRRGSALGVRTADCLPILIEARDTGYVAAVHAGWRGVIADIAGKAVDRLLADGAHVASMRVAIGPCIRACCFAVSGDLPERFAAAFGAEVVVGPTPHLDLGLAVRTALHRRGLLEAQIDVLPVCTRCDLRFFSHRRDAGITGRQLSFITCGATAM